MRIAKNIRAFLFFFLFLSVLTRSIAQEKHFVYIQSENKHAFTVKLNEKTFTSTANGYLILSQLTSGKYYLITDFNNHEIPQQNFVLDIAKDAGYSLKQFGDKGWGLFDIIDFTTIMADNSDSVKAKTTEIASVEKPVEEKKIDEPKNIPVTSTNVNETPAKNLNQPVAEKKVVVPPVNTEVKKLPITKSYEKQSSKGVDQIYIDRSENKVDTIAIFIPKTEVTIPAKKITTEVAKKKCIAIADNDDFYQARADMAASTNDEAMIQVAKRFFKTKCFSVEQIKNLGVLFLSEPARYRFFETAKPSMSDVENYPSLEAQFTLPALIEKFRASLKID